MPASNTPFVADKQHLRRASGTPGKPVSPLGQHHVPACFMFNNREVRWIRSALDEPRRRQQRRCSRLFRAFTNPGQTAMLAAGDTPAKFDHMHSTGVSSSGNGAVSNPDAGHLPASRYPCQARFPGNSHDRLRQPATKNNRCRKHCYTRHFLRSKTLSHFYYCAILRVQFYQLL